MTQISAPKAQLKLATISPKRKPNVPKMPSAIHHSLSNDYKSLCKSLINADAFRDELLPTIEAYFVAVYLVRSASEHLNAYGPIDENGKQSAAATLLGKTVPVVRSLAAALGLLTGAQQAGASSRAAPDVEKAAVANPWGG